MNNNIIKEKIIVNEQVIGVMVIDGIEYISLTDLAKYANQEEPKIPIWTWLKNKDVISYLGLWETIHNSNFKRIEFDAFKNKSGQNSFFISPKKWINNTNAIGIISKSGRYDSGTYAVSDIALEFASWLSPEFKLYVIEEFQRLKKDEAYRNKIDWHANRILAKVNYLVHTDAIKNNIVPILSESQKRFIYQEEADLINVALFGMTAKEWREANKELSHDGNIRDYTDLLHLVILSNLENINAELIKSNLSQRERLIKLNEIARHQMELLCNNKTINNLKYLDSKDIK